jgi:hypothetical protein
MSSEFGKYLRWGMGFVFGQEKNSEFGTKTEPFQNLCLLYQAFT